MSICKITLTTFCLSLNLSQPALAAFEPIALTPYSFNQDIIVEKSAPRPVLPATSASMDGDSPGTGYAWFERGYLPDWPSAGLPEAGTVFASPRMDDHIYQMAPDYKSND